MATEALSPTTPDTSYESRFLADASLPENLEQELQTLEKLVQNEIIPAKLKDLCKELYACTKESVIDTDKEMFKYALGALRRLLKSELASIGGSNGEPGPNKLTKAFKNRIHAIERRRGQAQLETCRALNVAHNEQEHLEPISILNDLVKICKDSRQRPLIGLQTITAMRECLAILDELQEQDTALWKIAATTDSRKSPRLYIDDINELYDEYTYLEAVLRQLYLFKDLLVDESFISYLDPGKIKDLERCLDLLGKSIHPYVRVKQAIDTLIDTFAEQKTLEDVHDEYVVCATKHLLLSGRISALQTRINHRVHTEPTSSKERKNHSKLRRLNGYLSEVRARIEHPLATPKTLQIHGENIISRTNNTNVPVAGA